MSRNVSVTEPHPSVARRPGGFIGSGRGGAGNYQSYKPTDLTEGPSATGPAARISLRQPAPRAVKVGRAGAGNIFPPRQSEERVFQFDEELVKKREHAASVYHIGRGGQGNLIDETKPRTQRTGSSGSTSSVESDRSSVRRSVEGAFGRLQRKISKQ